MVQKMPNFDERLARELVQGLLRSALARRVDPSARLHQFRTLQLAAIAMSREPAVLQAAEQLVQATDLALQKLAPGRS